MRTSPISARHRVGALVLLAAAYAAPPDTVEPDARGMKYWISAVANALLPAVVLEREDLEGWTLAERMDHYNVPAVPGTSWQYSGGGYTVMEQALEDVTGH